MLSVSRVKMIDFFDETLAAHTYTPIDQYITDKRVCLRDTKKN